MVERTLFDEDDNVKHKDNDKEKDKINDMMMTRMTATTKTRSTIWRLIGVKTTYLIYKHVVTIILIK